jgi:murein DD-endopeptidase MepM/ murein hydrolase activator NlpD
VQLFALDQVGNIGNSTFYYRAARTRRPERRRVLEPGVVERYLGALLKTYQKNGFAGAIPSTLAEQFRIVNEDLRSFTEKRLQRVLKSSADEWMGRGPFLRQRGAITVEHGDYFRVFNGEEQVGGFIQQGVDFLTPRGTPVVAADQGVVSYVGELGLYGNAVVIDHGFGIATLYGYLGEITTKVGAKVVGGDELGVVGNTGLSFGERLHFEVRVQGVPVRPIEWWDRRWLSDHFVDKLAEVKRITGVRTAEDQSGAKGEQQE